MLSIILRPFSYLTISHKDKLIVDWVYPTILSILTCVLLYLIRENGNLVIFGSNGLLAEILQFVESLPGFFIAALAAIATFNRTDIDRTMPDPAPKIDINIEGESIKIELTRRRFLCSMFAFLTANSFLIILIAIFGNVTAGYFFETLNPSNHTFWIFSFLFLLVFLVWQLVITAFWGLYYLGDKLHQPDRK